MRKLLATMSLAAAVAAVMTSPVLAQSRTHRQAPDPFAAGNPYDAYAAAPYDSYRPAQRRSARGSNSVYDIRGHRVGADPDPTVRDQIAHDPTQGD
jgi:hypothetical protein